MRCFSRLSFVSASLIVLAHGIPAAASSGIVLKRGAFRPQGVALTAGAKAPVLEKAAERVLAEHVAPSRHLAFGRARHVALTSGARMIKRPQTHLGLPVAHRGATISFAGDSARLVTARLETDLPADVTPAITSDTAAAIAERRTGVPAGPGRTSLELWPTPEGTRLAWVVSASAIPGVPYQPVTVIDAKQGDILYVYNAIVALNAARIFPSNPVKSPDLVVVSLPVSEGATTLTNDLVQAMSCIDRKSVKKIADSGSTYEVHMCDLLQAAAPDANGDYLIEPAADDDPEDAFAEVSMFHHVNRAYSLFRSWDPELDVNGGAPLMVVSNLRTPQGFGTMDLERMSDPELPLEPFQNAFFAPESPFFSEVFAQNGGALWFGQGPNFDYSYDGDIVYHELTHAVVHATLRLVATPHMDEFGASFAPGAMNEALADYFSSAITGDGDVGEYIAQDPEFDGAAIRSLTDPDACPTAIVGDAHSDATLFSGALWDARVALPEGSRAKLDEAVFAAMNAAPTGDLSYDDMAELIIDQVTTIVGEEAALPLTEAFTKRGVLPKCTRVLEVKDGVKTEGPPALYGLWIAPGTQTTGAKNEAGGWTPGVVQFHLTLPANKRKLELFVVGLRLVTGGNGTEFSPKFLARFSEEPITFTYRPTTTTPDVQFVDVAQDGNFYTGTLDIPAGATDVHVMVVNTGEENGAYINFKATTLPAGPSSPGGGVAIGGSGGTRRLGGGKGEDDGCGCTTPGTSAPGGAAFMALAALGLAAARRRRARAS